MEDLIDIEGLGQIGLWPLAIGWWVLAAVLLISVVVGSIFWYKRFKYKASWQYKSYSILDHMQKQLDHTEPKLVLQKLSLELRKIAMLTTKREACAGLIGKPWLTWLQQHDPAGFNWQENGGILLTAQYMPDTLADDSKQVSKLILAAKNWVHKC